MNRTHAAVALLCLAACTANVRADDPPKPRKYIYYRARPISADFALGDGAGVRPGAGCRPNKLIRERSPYLREHAFDPVDWHPWGAAAFAEAKKRDVPLFVSSGYSTCHWCHVMHRESFEDEEVAEKLNASFVCVKVDREELPDVDESLIRAVEAIQDSAGWPCTVFLSPDGRPFYGGTYYPRNALIELVGNIAGLWNNPEKRKGVLGDADKLVEFLKQHAEPAAADKAALDKELIHGAVRDFAKIFDAKNGGFRKAPKFPCAPELSFLLAHSHSDAGRTMALLTLEKILEGGVTDQLGGGFHRYATDEQWRVPHFEKTLYDQALLLDALVDAYSLTKAERFAAGARRTVAYVLRDLRLPSGGFASAEDADSAGGEGLFYTWTQGEVEAALGTDRAKPVCAHFGIEPAGSGPVEGRSVLRVAAPLDPAIERDAIAALTSARDLRVRPPRDEKVLTGWNGLMIAALARASVVLDEPRWLDAAREAARLIDAKLVGKDGRLLRRLMGSEARFPGALEDHAYLARAYLALYEADLDPEWLERARDLLAKAKALYWDGSRFTSHAKDLEALAAAPADSTFEGALPSPAATLAIVDLRVSVLTGTESTLARSQLEGVSSTLKNDPVAAPTSLSALDLLITEPVEVVISGRPGPMTDALVRAARTGASASRLVALVDGSERAARVLGELAKDRAPGERPRAFVCIGKTCQAPVEDPGALVALLAKTGR